MMTKNASITCLLTVAGFIMLAGCSGSTSGGANNSTTTPLDPKNSTVIATSALSDITSCTNGGVHVDWGIDKDGDGILDGDEITGGGDICNGTDGGIGINGASTVLRTSAADTETCPSGGIVIQAGLDAVPYNSQLDAGEVNPSLTSTICNGASGIDGQVSLVDVQTEPEGDNCADGGVVVRSGVDTTGDGSLNDESGITPEYICNGPIGLTGDDGASTIVLSETVTNDTGTCPLSGNGVKLTIWLDVNGNKLIDDGNETHTAICNGSNGNDGSNGLNALVVTSIEPPGDNCAYGGLKIRSGQDTTGVQGLDDEPEAGTSYVCHGGGSTLIQVPDWQTTWFGRDVGLIGLSTWDRVNGLDQDAWVTAGETAYFYDAYLLTNRSGGVQDVDVAVGWSGSAPGDVRYSESKSSTPAYQKTLLPWIPPSLQQVTIMERPVDAGNVTLYGYPFNPLLPLDNVRAWSDIYDGDANINWLTFSLVAGESVVLVPSPTSRTAAPSYSLHVAASTVLDASEADASGFTHSGTAVLDKPQRFRLTSLTAGTIYQAIATSGGGDDAGVFAHSGPFSFADCTANGSFVNACALTANGTGNAWVEVQGTNLVSTGDYTLDVRHAPNSVGASDDRVLLTLGTAASSSVGPVDYSYYSVSSFELDTKYKVRLSGLYPSWAVDMDFKDDIEAFQTCYGSPGATELECLVRTSPGDVLKLEIDVYEDPSYNQGGAAYSILVTPAAEGTAAEPYSLPDTSNQESPANSSVDNTMSYYQLAGPTGYSLDWSVALNNIVCVGCIDGDVLNVTITADGASPISTCEVAWNATTVSCTVNGIDQLATVLSVTVDGSGTPAGATYQIGAVEMFY